MIGRTTLHAINRPQTLGGPAVLTAGLCLLALTALAAEQTADQPPDGSKMDHAGHDMSQMSRLPDAEGQVRWLEVRWAGGDMATYAIDRVDAIVTIDQKGGTVKYGF